jgi:hypothetical protein
MASKKINLGGDPVLRLNAKKPSGSEGFCGAGDKKTRNQTIDLTVTQKPANSASPMIFLSNSSGETSGVTAFFKFSLTGSVQVRC